jgi:hypothetical protein
MILIAHRGNVSGPSNYENDPALVKDVLPWFNIEIDVWSLNGQFFLGHYSPEHLVDQEFLLQKGLWCHAKNLEALKVLKQLRVEHYFWHDVDDCTLTSSGYFWTFPGKPMCEHSIFVMPEVVLGKKGIVSFKPQQGIAGYCTDYPAFLDLNI